MKHIQKRVMLIVLIGLIFTVSLTAQVADTTATGKLSDTINMKINDTIGNSSSEFRISFNKVVWAVLVFMIGYFLIRFFTKILDSIAEKWTKWRLTVKGVVPILRISGWTFVLYIIIADIIAPPIQTLLAVTASAGIAVGFASQDILKNIFGGIMILFDRPFQVGDKISVGAHYGEVVSIGLRTVRIITADDSQVSIPNSEIVSQSVSNSNSGQSNCQVVAEFFLPPEIDTIAAKRIAYLAAAVSRYVYLNKPITVILKNEIHMGRSVLKLRLKAYVLDIRYEFLFMSEMTEKVINEYLARGLVSADQLAGKVNPLN